MNPWTNHLVEYETVLRRVEGIAANKGFILNPDGERVQKVVGLMTVNLVKAGNYFCPCKQSHPLDTTKDLCCPCPTWEEEIQKDGHCFCKLFYRKNPQQG